MYAFTANPVARAAEYASPILTVRPSTQEELDEREIFLDADRCLSMINPAGGVIGVADAETHEVIWISPQGDHNAVFKAIAEHTRPGS